MMSDASSSPSVMRLATFCRPWMMAPSSITSTLSFSSLLVDRVEQLVDAARAAARRTPWSRARRRRCSPATCCAACAAASGAALPRAARAFTSKSGASVRPTSSRLQQRLPEQRQLGRQPDAVLCRPRARSPCITRPTCSFAERSVLIPRHELLDVAAQRRLVEIGCGLADLERQRRRAIAVRLADREQQLEQLILARRRQAAHHARDRASAIRPSSVRKTLPGCGSAWKKPSTMIWCR